MLKNGAKILAESVTQIFNMSLGSKFPEGCKTASPIFNRTKKLQTCFTSACNV